MRFQVLAPNALSSSGAKCAFKFWRQMRFQVLAPNALSSSGAKVPGYFYLRSALAPVRRSCANLLAQIQLAHQTQQIHRMHAKQLRRALVVAAGFFIGVEN